MFVSNCPRCDEAVRVPGGHVPDGAQAQCPWCREMFPLAEVTDQLPPLLQIVTADGQPIASGLELISEDDTGHAAPSPFAASAETVAADTVTEDAWHLDPRTARDELPLDDFSSRPMITRESSNSVGQMNVMPVVVRRRKKGSGIRTAIGVVLGGLMAVPLAGGLLTLLGRPPDWGFWPFDGPDESTPQITAAAPGPVSDRDRNGFDSSFSANDRPFGQSLLSSSEEIPLEAAETENEDPQKSALDQILPDADPAEDDTGDQTEAGNPVTDDQIGDVLPPPSETGPDRSVAEKDQPAVEDVESSAMQEDGELLLTPENDDFADAASTSAKDTEVTEQGDPPVDSLLSEQSATEPSSDVGEPSIKIPDGKELSGDPKVSVDAAASTDDTADSAADAATVADVDSNDADRQPRLTEKVDTVDSGEDDPLVPSIDPPANLPEVASAPVSIRQPSLGGQPEAGLTDVNTEPLAVTESPGPADVSEEESMTLQPAIEPTVVRDTPQLLARVESAGAMVDALASFTGPKSERRKLLAQTYQEVARACEPASKESEAIRSLATKIAGSPEVLRDIELAGLEWLQYGARTTEGAALVGRPGSGDEGPVMTLPSGKVVKVSGTDSLPATEKVLALGRIVGDDTVELVVAEIVP